MFKITGDWVRVLNSLVKIVMTSAQARPMTANEFEKNFFKLMNNAVFGKCMENVRNRIHVDIVQDEKLFKKRVAKTTFKRSQKIRKDLHAVEMYNATTLLNKPITVGFAILELSKTLMYKFHYNHMKVRYPDYRLKLLFTDTDSLCYAVKTDDIYRDMESDALEKYDFSGYPFDHPLYSEKNKKIIGMMKDELDSIPLEEVVALRPKCYCLKYHGKVKKNQIVNKEDIVEKPTAAGTKRSIKDSKLKFNHYLKTLMTKKNQYVTQNNIISHKHTLYTVNQTKISLSAQDTKRYILSDGINTLAHGHYRIKNGTAEEFPYQLSV